VAGSTKKKTKHLYVCTDCDSSDVELQCWVDANLDIVLDDVDDNMASSHCNDCGANRQIKHIEVEPKDWDRGGRFLESKIDQLKKVINEVKEIINDKEF